MSGLRRLHRLLVAGLAAGILVLVGPLRADAAVITSFVGLLQAAAGQGWAPHPDQTAGGTEQFVTGPMTPPAGTGSLQMTDATTTDRALVFTVPNPGTGDTPPGSEGPFNPVAWGSTSGSFATFTADTASPGSSIPVLKFVGYQNFNANNPLLSTGFTTLNFEGSNQGAVVPNQWQTWTLNADSLVWQSNQADAFCPISAPCTLAAFAAQYPDGAWGQIQLGLGAGVPANTTGYVDNVQVSDGTTTFVYDFEVTAPTGATTTTTTTAPTGAGAGGATATTAAATASGSALARTGSHTGEALVLALACIGFGAVLTVAAKRRRTIH